MDYFGSPVPVAPSSSAVQGDTGSDDTLPAGSIKQETQQKTRTPVGTPVNSPGAVSVSTAFHPSFKTDDSLPDLIITSVDGVHFYIHRNYVLAMSKNRLGGLLPSRLDNPTSASSCPSIQAKQSAEVLNVAMHAIYGLSCLQYFPTLEVVESALAELIVFGVSIQLLAAANKPLYQLLLSFASDRPMDVYALAGQHSLEDAAVAASARLLDYDVSQISDAVAAKMGPLYLKRLFMLQQSRVVALRSILFRPPAPHPPSPECSPESQQLLMRSWAWALATAQRTWVALPGLSTDALKSLLEPVGNNIDCPLCAEALHRRIQEVQTEWSSVKSPVLFDA
ncbi:hypothetical protein BV20DRAFT_1032572 [Pilatotrama ljubarskyi]|nr:hypothetical protein BV20DRAFT_1032572 [Pilatotrama ljubarskyi]